MEDNLERIPVHAISHTRTSTSFSVSAQNKALDGNASRRNGKMLKACRKNGIHDKEAGILYKTVERIAN
ncbi:conserved hypothetical protein [Ricinus communis]|uniref:Uncharacterized protein n=2 Tax=Ricinus communis TaxID=3988 RepID=B9SL25_RICCO|nr:conserved hypothetical protein [Ricinus communis]